MKAYFGGMPTLPDITRIQKEYPSLSVGDFISYETLEKILQNEKNTLRFKTVVHSWRKKMMRENKIVLVPDPGIGLRVASPTERLDLSGRKIESGFRSIKMAARIAAETERDKLTEEQRKTCDHYIRIGSIATLAKKVEAKEIALPEGM
jgi:hypothetical protein